MPAESWISAGIYLGFLDWESEARVSCLREWSNSKVQMTPYREKKQGRESKMVQFKAWNKGPVWIVWTSHGSQNQAVRLWSIWFTVFFHGTVLHVKQTVKWPVWGFSGWTVRSCPGFKTMLCLAEEVLLLGQHFQLLMTKLLPRTINLYASISIYLSLDYLMSSSTAHNLIPISRPFIPPTIIHTIIVICMGKCQ